MVTLEKAPDLTVAFGPRGNDFLNRAINALVERLPVEEIWLFGSAARGDARPDSDLDLLVVLEDGHPYPRPTAECFRILFGMRNVVPPDVLALAKSEWEQEKAHPFGIYGDVLNQGIRVYAK